jgi:IS30 family transposase
MIKKMLDDGYSIKDIAKKLEVHQATIYREKKRTESSCQYNPELAHSMYLKQLKTKGRTPKLELDKALANYISKLILEESLSLEEVIKQLREEGYQNIPSKNTIYTAIDKDLIPYVTRATLLLKRKKTHMFSNGLIKVPKWICKELNLQDNEDLDIDVIDGTMIIKKSVKQL